MAQELIQSPDVDLERTDRLPVLDASMFDHTVGEDTSALESTGNMMGTSLVAAAAAGQSEFIRASTVDLPSLAESVRSVEERIARQTADYEALTRAFERVKDAETAATERAAGLVKDLAAARALLESEQGRTRDLDHALAERSTAVEAAHSRVEEALRESNRYQGEARTLRDSLAAREAAVAEALRSLAEREAQLAVLQAEHSKVLPELAASSKSSAQLTAELQSTRAQANSLATQLDASRAAVAALTEQFKRGEAVVKATRVELGAEKTKSNSFLEMLRTRDWRRGFDLNMFREMDAKVGAAYAGQNALEQDRNRLKEQVASLETRLGEQQAAAEAERARMTAEVATHEQALAKARELASAEAAELTKLNTDQAAQVAKLQAHAEMHEQELSVLMAHLKEARRPIESIEADVKRLTEDLTAKTTALANAEEDIRNLKATLERTRGALQEREFLIRRLERSESNNANVLGRIQTSIERLSAVPVGSSANGASGPATDWAAELIRIDGDKQVSHVLSRRTRIGRAAGCELQIEANSVSRHHALVILGPREAIIEDLNSTNGVLVNGRRISRQLLSDGDAVAIGDVQFRYMTRALSPGLPAKPMESTAQA